MKKIKNTWKFRYINKVIKKINKSYKRGEKNFWMKVVNKTQREEDNLNRII